MSENVDYTTIVNPTTNRRVKLSSKIGKKVLKNYLKQGKTEKMNSIIYRKLQKYNQQGGCGCGCGSCGIPNIAT